VTIFGTWYRRQVIYQSGGPRFPGWPGSHISSWALIYVTIGKKEEILFCPVGAHVSSSRGGVYTCELADRLAATPLHSSRLLPSTSTHAGPAARGGKFYRGTKERERRKAPTRLVYFCGHFAPGFSLDVPDLPSDTTSVPLARDSRSLRPATPRKRQLFNEPPSFSTSSRAPELQHLWRWAWRRLRGHAWCIAKKLRIAGCRCANAFRQERCFVEPVDGSHKWWKWKLEVREIHKHDSCCELMARCLVKQRKIRASEARYRNYHVLREKKRSIFGRA